MGGSAPPCLPAPCSLAPSDGVATVLDGPELRPLVVPLPLPLPTFSPPVRSIGEACRLEARLCAAEALLVAYGLDRCDERWAADVA